MTLTELRYIVTLAHKQHFGQAAEHCNVSQPTLSIAVKKLEQELEVELFERSKNSVRPTPIGEQIIARARQVLEQSFTIYDIATLGKDQLKNPLKVGAIFSIGPYLFPHFIPELQKLAPHMPLVVEEGYTATLRHRLRDGDVDVIIVSLPFTEPDVVTQSLYSEPFVLLLPESHPLAARQVIRRGDLEQENVLLLGAGHCFRDQVLESLPELNREAAEANRGIRTHTEGSSLETLRHMVATGLGITVLPQSAAESTYYKGLTIRPFEDPTPCRQVALAWRVSFPQHKAIDTLRQAIKANPLPSCEICPLRHAR